MSPGERHLHVQRVVALPELYGPAVRGLPASENGFMHVDRYNRMLDVGRRLAVGEAQIYSDGLADMVAHAIATYALPTRDR